MDMLRAKAGPFAVWLWLVIITIAGLAYYLYEQHKNAASGTTAAGTNTPEGYAQVPETVNQTDITFAPPTAPEPGKAVKVTVPDVIGEQYEAGAPKVSKAGLIAQRGEPDVGVVKRESPSAGSHITKGSVVTLSGKPWPQTQKDHKGSPPPKKKKGGKVDPGGPDKQAPPKPTSTHPATMHPAKAA